MSKNQPSVLGATFAGLSSEDFDAVLVEVEAETKVLFCDLKNASDRCLKAQHMLALLDRASYKFDKARAALLEDERRKESNSAEERSLKAMIASAFLKQYLQIIERLRTKGNYEDSFDGDTVAHGDAHELQAVQVPTSIVVSTDASSDLASSGENKMANSDRNNDLVNESPANAGSLKANVAAVANVNSTSMTPSQQRPRREKAKGRDSIGSQQHDFSTLEFKREKSKRHKQNQLPTSTDDWLSAIQAKPEIHRIRQWQKQADDSLRNSSIPALWCLKNGYITNTATYLPSEEFQAGHQYHREDLQKYSIPEKRNDNASTKDKNQDSNFCKIEAGQIIALWVPNKGRRGKMQVVFGFVSDDYLRIEDLNDIVAEKGFPQLKAKECQRLLLRRIIWKRRALVTEIPDGERWLWCCGPAWYANRTDETYGKRKGYNKLASPEFLENSYTDLATLLAENQQV